MDVEKRIKALEGRVAILEAALGAALAGDEDDDERPTEDLDGNAIPRAGSGW